MSNLEGCFASSEYLKIANCERAEQQGAKLFGDIKSGVLLNDGDSSKARDCINRFVERGFANQSNMKVMMNSLRESAFKPYSDQVLEMLAKGNKSGLKELIETCLQGQMLKE